MSFIGQFTGNKIIKSLTKQSATVVRLESGSHLKVGGLGLTLDAPLDLNTAINGLGGLDVGSIVASSFYYVYAVISGSNFGLVCSLSSVSPTGFLAYRLVGGFYTDSLSQNNKAIGRQNLLAQDSTRLHTANGWGSTNTKIRRFSSIANYNNGYTFGATASTQTSANGLYTITDSATSGTEITINRDCEVKLSISDNTGSSVWIGFSLNSTQLATSIQIISASDKLISSYESIATGNASASWSGKLKSGDVVRPHGAGVAGGIADEASLSISAQAESPLAGLL